jgi:hypothetical protein
MGLVRFANSYCRFRKARISSAGQRVKVELK